MSHFTPALFSFLRDLKKHNDRAWFADNKARYVQDVRDPFLQFIGDFAPRLKHISRAYVADKRKTGGSMFRIYRDTRFSPDKSPLKTWIAARFPHEARRKVEGGVPGFFLHIGPGDSFGGGGVYHIELPQLTAIRHRIVDEPKAWKAAVKGIELQGEQLKRAPSGFPATHELIEDLKRQQFYTLAPFAEKDVVSDGFIDQFTASCERAAPLIEFQTKALGLRW
ncbi:MAG TPA: TIGR02453 family protein [Vicinamibacterales bacterium]|nr:TIGR02453 family protein [Vicinamibacterales bacterium]